MPRSPQRPEGGRPIRLQVYLARAGVASRRASEELIAQGRVSVNGSTVTVPGTQVTPGRDRVEMDGEAVQLAETLWVALHKPRGYVSTRDDPFDRKTVYELLPPNFASLFHVGRLDRDSEGLLLLSNDGALAHQLLHPSFGTTKEYEADVRGRPHSSILHQLTRGVELEDGVASAVSVDRLHQVDDDVFRIRLVLAEGKKREVRRMLEAVGHPVVRLRRLRFGPVNLGELPSGRWRVLGDAEVASLRPRR
ncbi:MAG: rRNA pseudouridine synthase [Gemmatimonadota bacterium]|jgi:23S rRNA pseudouridine2605 synthase|nr:rRNA pseudouridine synthase [Gemmatimonadota bacterium]